MIYAETYFQPIKNYLPYKTWYYWFFTGITNIFLIIILFFSTVNSLTSVPIDKVLICICPVIYALANPDKTLFSSKEFLVLIALTAIAVLSSILNLIIFPMIYFPMIGFCFAIIIRRNKLLILQSLYYALLIHIILGLILLSLAFLGLNNSYVSGDVKGFTFLYSAHGLTATVQTFGTLCVSWLMIYVLRRKLYMNTFVDKFFLFINTIAVLLTFSRSTYLFWLIVLFFEFSILFWFVIIAIIAAVIKFWNLILLFVLSSASITARSEILEGFKISYVRSNSFIVYLFGRGTNQISESIAKTVKWTTRTDLENGYAMLLHAYGVIGLLTYATICLYFICKFLKRKKIAEAIILFFYFFITQYITQEFVSVTYYIFLGIMLLIYDYYENPDQFNLSVH